MKVIICGSRSITSYAAVEAAVRESGFKPCLIISGGARGVDRLGEAWARANGVPYRVIPARWDRHGRSAGYRRNEAMAREADAVIAVWDGVSRGTKHMIDRARSLGLLVHVHEPGGRRP